jgi:hypothetical protein
VDALPDREQVLSDIPRAVGFLLTRLFSHERALLHAERLGPEPERDVTWYVRPRGVPGEGDDAPVAALPAGIFSSIVSRLALAFDIDYTSGGYGRRDVPFEGRRFDCRLFFSRCAASGYWVRLYAAARPEGESATAAPAPPGA